MKKALVLLLACLMAVNVSAQKAKSSSSAKKTTSSTTKKSSSSKKSHDGTISKGTFFFNTNATNISFNSFSVGDKDGGDTQSLTRFGLQGTGGYGLMNNLALVGGLGFQYGKYSDSALTAFTLNAGARYYIVSNFYASGMFVLGLTSVNNNTGKGGSVGGKGHTFGFDIGVGYSIFLTPKIALEPNISYSIGLSNKMEDAEYKLNSLTANIGFTILL